MGTKELSKGISIVIPTIGRESLTNVLTSIHLDETLKQHEILIVAKPKICERLKHKYREYKCITLVPQQKANISKSRNLGIVHSKFKIISPIDDDDVWVNGRAKLFQDILQEGENVVVFGSAHFSVNNRHKINKLGSNQLIKSTDFLKIFNPKILSKQNYFLQVGNCAFRKNAQLPRFNEKLAYLEDQIWILDLLQHAFTIKQIKEITIEYSFSRERANCRWDVNTEKEIFKRLNEIDMALARKYVFKRSLKSLALSPNTDFFNKAKLEIIKEFHPKGKEKLQILFLSIINVLINVFKNFSRYKMFSRHFHKLTNIRKLV